MVNAVLPEERQDAALEVLRRERLRLISLTPVRSSLEEYYIQKTRPTEAGKEKPVETGLAPSQTRQSAPQEAPREEGQKQNRKGVGV
jgi:hypothetical protein